MLDLQDQELARLQSIAEVSGLTCLPEVPSLTIWLNAAMTWEAVPTGERGRQSAYGDAMICLTIKALIGMALR